MSNYPTNLTEKQWQVIKNIVEPQERNRKGTLREIVNGIFYVNKSGCQWRMLPSDFAPWQTVYYYFRKWKLEGVWEELLNVLHEANIHDSKGAKPTIENLAYKFPRLSKILADGGYQGDLAAWVKDKFGWE